MKSKKVEKINIPIIQKDDKVLRQIAKTVNLEEIKTQKLQKIIAEMKQALDGQDDGVAIAAPQIGVSLRIFVVSKKVELINKGLENVSEKDRATLVDSVYINPEIKKVSKTKKQLDEGCLSVRYLYGKVPRAEKITITAYDEKGKKFTAGASGLLAQIFQHEIDHLNGILFIDKADNLTEVLPNENE